MEDFDYLFGRYIARQETPEERGQLMAMIHSGKFQDALDQKLLDFSDDNADTVRMTPAEVRSILATLQATVIEKETIPLYRRAWFIPAAAVFVVALLAGLWILQPPKASLPPEAEDIADAHFLHLPDGTSVTLNAGSELTYDPAFGKEQRVVTLRGEAFFDVVHDPKRPFIVRTGSIRTTVLGTAFNISAYPNAENIRVTVTRGRVRVGDDTRTYAEITPHQQIAIAVAKGTFTTQRVQTEAVLAWKKDFLILDNVTFEEAAARIADRFDVKVAIEQETLKPCRMSTTFLQGENLEAVLEHITLLAQATYRRDDDTITIIGGTCQ
jgi:ferric-dicitrate binding protein FerR (iron transport regulator)